MAFIISKDVSIKGISACVPKNKEHIEDIYRWEGVENFINTTGIISRRHASPLITTADLCLAAAEKLIEELKWEKKDIDALVVVTQTPDFKLPATSCLLQSKLGLSQGCYTLDISLGCSGWVYAMSVVTSLMQNGNIKRALLLAGDTLLKICSPEDKSTAPLFGDAGTATAFEYLAESGEIKYVFNTDGEGFETIIVPYGGYRNLITSESLLMKEERIGICRSGVNLVLDGMNVFSFGISKAPKSITTLIENFNLDKDDIDLFSFHQANMLMNEKIRKKLKLPKEKVPYSIKDFANTSSASIPLTLVTQERTILQKKHIKHIACGFGVGLSWGSVYFETNNIVVPELIEI